MSITAREIIDMEFSLAIAQAVWELENTTNEKRAERLERQIKTLSRGLNVYMRTLGRRYSMEINQEVQWIRPDLWLEDILEDEPVLMRV